MRRREFLAGLLAIPVLVACDPRCPVPAPPGGGDDVGMTTAGLAALVEGEEWHYVGEAGEPAFENGWETPSGYIKLAFRIRESGAVDIQGDALNGIPGLPIFTLPVGYRPNNNSQMAVSGGVSSATVPAVAVIGSTGEVAGLASPSLPDSVSFLGQFFLDSPEVAP